MRRWAGRGGGGYLFHVPVVHGVVWHLVRLQLDDLLELVAVAFPLADYDHFVKQEDVPEGGGGARLRTGCCSSDNERHSWLCASVFLFFFILSLVFLLTGPAWSGWRWSRPSAPRRSSACRTPPAWPAAYVTRATHGVNPLHIAASKFNQTATNISWSLGR